MHARPNIRLMAAAIAALSASWGAAAAAQTVPSSADAARATGRFEPAPALPQTEPALTREDAPLPPATAQNSFVLGGVDIRGMSVYDPGRFVALYQPFIGKRISVPQVQQIASRITRQYQQDGYALAASYVPTQTVDDGGTVVIQVEEGRVGKVEFLGDEPPAAMREQLMAQVDKIRAQSPIRTDALEHYVLMMNDLPGNTVRAVLRPSASDPGATDLFVYYLRKPFEASFATDNRGSRYLGPWQHSLTLTGNGTLGMNERVTLRGITSSPVEELGYADLQYDQPVGEHGTRIVVTASAARTQPGEDLKDDRVKGETRFLQARAVHPFLRSRLENLYGRVSFGMRNSVTDAGSSRLTSDRIRSLRVGATYEIADASGATIIDGELSRGIDGLGATDEGAGRSNSSASQDYTKATFDLSRNQSLPYDFSLLMSASGQYAFDTLLGAEQYLVGGPLYGTAYDPAELAGDHGLAGKAELRYGQRLNDPLLESYQLYGFYDIGRIWRKSPVGSEPKRESLASAGAGLRANISERTSANLELAFPLTRDLASDPDNDGRFYGGLTVKY